MEGPGVGETLPVILPSEPAIRVGRGARFCPCLPEPQSPLLPPTMNRGQRAWGGAVSFLGLSWRLSLLFCKVGRFAQFGLTPFESAMGCRKPRMGKLSPESGVHPVSPRRGSGELGSEGACRWGGNGRPHQPCASQWARPPPLLSPSLSAPDEGDGAGWMGASLADRRPPPPSLRFPVGGAHGFLRFVSSLVTVLEQLVQ